MNSEQHQRFFYPVDLMLSDKYAAAMIDDARNNHLTSESELDEDIPLDSEDIELLRKYALEPGPRVRAVAVEILCAEGPITWDGLESWPLDPDKLVRGKAMFAMSLNYTSAGQLCDSDKPRCARILADVIERYTDGYAGVIMESLSERDSEWYEIIIKSKNRLLKLNRFKIEDILDWD